MTNDAIRKHFKCKCTLTVVHILKLSIRANVLKLGCASYRSPAAMLVEHHFGEREAMVQVTLLELTSSALFRNMKAKCRINTTAPGSTG